MPSLKGSNVGPLDLDNPLGRLNINKDKQSAARSSVEKALAEWEALKGTHQYQVLRELADPKITYYRAEICKGILDFQGWPVDVVKEHQAECRGALREWLIIRDQPGMLKRQLDELVKQEEEERKASTGPSEATKQKLKNYV